MHVFRLSMPTYPFVLIMHASVIVDFGFSSRTLFGLFESGIGPQFVHFPIWFILLMICMICLVLDFYFDEHIYFFV